MRKRNLWFILAASVVIAGLVIALRIYRTPAEDGWKIGAILPLTGSAADIGTQAKQGLDVAAKQLRLNVVYEDSQSEPKQAISAFRKLTSTNSGRLIGVISMLSGVGNAIIPIGESEQIVTIHLASAPRMTTGKKYAFRWYITSEAQMNALVDYLHRHGVPAQSRIAFLSVNDDYGRGAVEEFVTSFVRIYGQPPTVLRETYEKDQTDFRNTVARVKSFTPEVVAIAGYNNSLGILVRQLREQRVAARLFVGDDAISYPDILKVAGPTADGFVFPGLQLAQSEQNTAGNDFFQEYEREFHRPVSDFAVFAFGMAEMLSSCAPREYKLDSEAIKQCLETRVHETPLGPVSFDAKTHEGQVPLIYKEIENGEVKVVGQGK